MDARVRRTQALLMQAFDELIGAKPVDRISVSELCELASVRRATFYKHFADMQDFIRYYLTTLTDRFMAQLETEGDLDDLLPYAGSMHAHMLRYFEGHRHVFRHLMGTDMLTDTMDLVITQVADGIITRTQALIDSGGASPRASARAIGTYYSAGLAHTMRRRMLDSDPRPIDEVVDEGLAVLEDMLGITAPPTAR